METTVTELPLLVITPDIWAKRVLEDPLPLLNDHAHLEKKAAANALELLHRWPNDNPPRPTPEHWVKMMTSIAKDEIEHLAICTRLLSRRGGILTKEHRNSYVAALRQLVRRGRGNEDLVDRLMVSALVEARSCERFHLLGEHCEDKELADLYRGLWASERGHYQVFINFAREVLPDDAVEARWQEMLEAEAEIIQAQEEGPRMHSWYGA